MAEYGVINEIGDLGLGFTPLSESEQKQLKEQQEKEDKKADKEERESSTQLAQNSSEIDKATLKEIDKQYNAHYQMGTNNLDSIFKSANDEITTSI